MQQQQQQQQQMFLQLQMWFQAVDTDKSGLVEPEELVRALSQGGYKFSISTASLLIKMFDQNKKGAVNFQEFIPLYQFITQMQQSFYNVDRDKGGTIDFNELATALQYSGFQFPPNVVQELAKRFGKNGQILLDGWISLCAFLGHVRTLFVYYDTDKDGRITLDFNSFVMLAAMLQ
ncbi:peflin [Anaeramoeba ignava]|uniref:Peflin n=1 Tax=Anaeramoeba ignava TaxID=1746090 RepID=A0A9Q0L7E6_ANAIG|nr:peflin [Anaeramoeba ignava]